ncbi:hypothetical protein [Chryseobacterium sp. SIMBA_029]|uniref:hypothetical protein n=1 Tax=Chryseobacterium sp. SIMBA_029 TaxID=3085772 RepID=UPI00397CC19E
MGFYSNFSEQDLIISYTNQIDHQGKANKEILEEIAARGSLESFHAIIEKQNEIQNERNRIIREIHQYFMDKQSQNECLSKIKSDILSREDIHLLVRAKYSQIHKNVENLKVDSKTILYSLIGAIIASVISTIVILLILYQFIFLSVFAFSLLIPAYIMNYWIIRLITGKTRVNLAVFIASFLATVLNGVYFFLVINSTH